MKECNKNIYQKIQDYLSKCLNTYVEIVIEYIDESGRNLHQIVQYNRTASDTWLGVIGNMFDFDFFDCKEVVSFVPFCNMIVAENYVVTVDEFMTFCETVNKKPTYTYPTTYEECCEVLMGKTNFSEFTLVPIKYSNTTKFDNNVSPDAPYMEIFNNLYTIIICRDAYWKIAGEQMGLDKPWKPDWNEETDKFTISNKCNKIYLNYTAWYAEVLSFPTEEMRNVFYENFKDLIEQCKELL
jgi:hypothetical protein